MHTRSGTGGSANLNGRSPPRSSKIPPSSNKKKAKHVTIEESAPRLRNTRHSNRVVEAAAESDAMSGGIGPGLTESSQNSDEVDEPDDGKNTSVKEPAVRRPASVSTRSQYTTRKSSPKISTEASPPQPAPTRGRPPKLHSAGLSKPLIASHTMSKRSHRQSFGDESSNDGALVVDDEEPDYPRHPRKRRLSANSNSGLLTYAIPRSGIDDDEAIIEVDESDTSSDEEIEKEEEDALRDDFELAEFDDLFSSDDDDEGLDSDAGMFDIDDHIISGAFLVDEDDLFTQDESAPPTPVGTPPPTRRTSTSTSRKHIQLDSPISSSNSSTSDEELLDPFFADDSTTMSFLSTQPHYGGMLAEETSDDDGSLLKYFFSEDSPDEDEGTRGHETNTEPEVPQETEDVSDEENDGDVTEAEDWESDINPTPKAKIKAARSVTNQLPAQLIYYSNHGPALGSWVADPERPIYLITQQGATPVQLRRNTFESSVENSPITPAESCFEREDSSDGTGSLWASRRGSYADFGPELFPQGDRARPLEFDQFIDLPDSDAEDTATVTSGMDDVTPSTPTINSPLTETLKTWDEVGVNAFRRRQVEHNRRGGYSYGRGTGNFGGHRRTVSATSLKRDAVMSPGAKRRSKVAKNASPPHKFGHARKRSHNGPSYSINLSSLFD